MPPCRRVFHSYVHTVWLHRALPCIGPCHNTQAPHIRQKRLPHAVTTKDVQAVVADSHALCRAPCKAMRCCRVLSVVADLGSAMKDNSINVSSISTTKLEALRKTRRLPQTWVQFLCPEDSTRPMPLFSGHPACRQPSKAAYTCADHAAQANISKHTVIVSAMGHQPWQVAKMKSNSAKHWFAFW